MFGWFKKRPKSSSREQVLDRAHPIFQQIDAGFRVYVDLVVAHPDWSEDQLEAELTRRGISPDLAQDLVSFVPMAFGREVVQQLGVRCSDHFRLHELSENWEQDKPLATEPTFAWAKAMVGEYRTAERNEIFKLIAGRSAELNVVNKALNSGVTVDELRESALDPSLVYLRRPKA